MRFITRCFCCDFEDEDQLSEQEPILFSTSPDAPENGGTLSQRLLSSSSSSASGSDRSPDGELIRHTWLMLSTGKLHDLDSLEIQECQDYQSNSSAISKDRLHYQNNLEFDKCHDDYKSNSSTTGSLRQEVLISSTSSLSYEDSNLLDTFLKDLEVPGLQRSLDAYTLLDNSGLVQVEKKDACLLEELYPQVSVEKNQDAYVRDSLQFEELKEKNQGGCLLEELLSKGPIEKKQHLCLLADLHPEQQIEDAEEKEEVVKGVVAEERWINHYSSFQKILLVGEGDFSFSACLANAFGSASNMIATSHDSREFLRKNYRRAIINIENLTGKECIVIHGVNTKELAKHPPLKGVIFDRIIFNFPFAGFFKNETRESQLRRHRRLVSKFLKNAREMINETGEIHITHKTFAFHREWNIEHLASCHGLRLIEAVRFHHRNYPGYMTKCGFGGDNYFNCNPSKTYRFGLRQPQQKKKAKRVSLDGKI